MIPVSQWQSQPVVVSMAEGDMASCGCTWQGQVLHQSRSAALAELRVHVQKHHPDYRGPVG